VLLTASALMSHFWEKADWNWLFRILAWSWGSECNRPSLRRCDTPLLSERLYLILVQNLLEPVYWLSSSCGATMLSIYFQ
jgi:hypothetical protein